MNARVGDICDILLIEILVERFACGHLAGCLLVFGELADFYFLEVVVFPDRIGVLEEELFNEGVGIVRQSLQFAYFSVVKFCLRFVRAA